MATTGRSGVLVMRVWQESPDAAGLRARITMLDDPESEEPTALTAAGRDAIVANVRTWLDEFAADGR
jgi:hypothetical protein